MEQLEGGFADLRVLGSSRIAFGVVALARIMACAHGQGQGLGDERVIGVRDSVIDYALANDRNGVRHLLETLILRSPDEFIRGWDEGRGFGFLRRFC